MTRKIFSYGVLLLFTILLTISIIRTARTDNRVKVVSVIDGDTFEIESGERVRLLGIDAPEDDSCSTIYLKNLIEEKAVRLEFEKDKRDKYGRLLAYAIVDDSIDAGAELVSEGLAFTYFEYPCSKTNDYANNEINAIKSREGYWERYFNEVRLGIDPERTVSGAMWEMLLEETCLIEKVNYKIESLEKAIEESQPINEVDVYITETGSKYHRKHCKYLRKSSKKISLKKAKAKGYMPCKKCNPPR